MLPDVPADTAAARSRSAHATLHTVISGSAGIVSGGAEVRAAAGTGVWVAAGDRVEVVPDQGSLVLPVPVTGDALPALTAVSMPESALPAALHAFTASLGYLEAEPRPLEVRSSTAAGPVRPPAPVTPALRALADALVAEPEADIPAVLGRTLPGWTLRTAQRRFLDETGLTLSAWQRRSRVCVAAELLANDRDLEWVAHRVGYRTVAGFIRAFSDEVGTTPGHWRAAGTGSAAGDPAAVSIRATPSAPHPAPAHRTWTRVNGAHVAVWAALGPASLTVRDERYELAEGEAIVIPAGMPNSLRIPSGSLLMPLGFRSGLGSAVGMPVRPAALGGPLSRPALEWMLAAYTSAGAPGVDPFIGFDTVLAEGAYAPAGAAEELLARLASLCSRIPNLSDAAAAARLGCEVRTLQSTVLELTGTSLPAWRRLSRMTGARNRLGEGARPTEIARDLGYAHPPAFTRAFRAVYGSPPAAIGQANPAAPRSDWGATQATARSTEAGMLVG